MAAGDSARAEAERVRRKIATLQRYLADQERGAVGEEQTAAALEALGDAWVRFHDVRWPGRRLANIDHVVVGPGGVFVIDSKNWSGRVEVSGAVLRQNGYRREGVVAGAADAALVVAELIGPHAAAVRPVLCFAGQRGMHGWVRDVMVCSLDTLIPMLTSRPVLLAPPEVLAVAQRLDAQLSAATDPPPEMLTATTWRRATDPRRSRRSSASPTVTAASVVPASLGRDFSQRSRAGRRGRSLRLTVGLALVVFGAPVILGLVSRIGDAFEDVLLPLPPCPTASPTAAAPSKSETPLQDRRADAGAAGSGEPAPPVTERGGAASPQLEATPRWTVDGVSAPNDC